MRVEYWSHSGISEDGSVVGGGSVDPSPGVRTSGNHHLQTRSTKRDGLWLAVTSGRMDDGTMHGITVYFRDEREMRDFERSRTSDINDITN